jgi:hypothetical protein
MSLRTAALGCAQGVSTRFYRPEFHGVLLIRFYPPPRQQILVGDWLNQQTHQAETRIEAAIANWGVPDSARNFTTIPELGKGFSEHCELCRTGTRREVLCSAMHSRC